MEAVLPASSLARTSGFLCQHELEDFFVPFMGRHHQSGHPFAFTDVHVGSPVEKYSYHAGIAFVRCHHQSGHSVFSRGIRIRTPVQEQLNQVLLAGCRGKHQGSEAFVFRGIDVSASVEEQSNHAACCRFCMLS